MTILQNNEIEKLCNVMDYILTNTKATVEKVERKFHLESDEYNMIMDISMPFLREANAKKYWYAKYYSIVRKISELGHMKKLSDAEFKKKVLKLINERSYNEPYMREAVGDDVKELEELNDSEIEKINKREILLLKTDSINN